ncbi:MAG: flagellar hook-basal body complex protein [Rhodospirillales bacterium]|nr:flagellar hook-basal body complex protein [Rhodospirillales bacterium]MCB9965553.1 flagellar hook-basal body complex protein [Rhodospirillales bacterium]MCB9979794.1 flagellar hook-basal body complex protein [Rhodospirillales bacterium]
MSLFGALFTGVSALSAQSQNTAIISNNIANVNTVGFKRSESSFESLVTTESRGSRYSPGTVAVNRIQRVDQQGPIQQSISSTDVAISGNGFFPVKRNGDDSALDEYLYTRNGQFSEDAQGNMRNSVGFYLYGWPLDSQGLLPSAQGDLSSLVPVDVAFLGGLTRPTNTVDLSINLNASEDNTSVSTATSLVAAGTPANFTRGVRVYDSLGASQDLSIAFTKVYGPMAADISSAFDMELTDLLTTQGMSATDQFSFTAAGQAAETFTVTATSTVSDFIDFINAYDGVGGGGGGFAEAFLNNNGELVIQAIDFTTGSTFTLTDVTGTPATDLGFSSGVAITPPDLPATANGTNADTPPYSAGEYPAIENLPGISSYNSRGWWQVDIVAPDGAYLTQGMINFNGDGSINALSDTDGNIDININSIDWGNGASLQDISIDIERFSQFSGQYNVIFSDQDGAELGLRTGVEIDRDGYVIARFSNGASSALYKVPMVTFANPNGLQEVSGTAYTKNEDSGEENLREAGAGGSGLLETSTLENSNVDLADEFAKLIISQRAFSAGTKVINTVDQMTEDLLRLR